MILIGAFDTWVNLQFPLQALTASDHLPEEVAKTRGDGGRFGNDPGQPGLGPGIPLLV
jgi:hypothetical protein